MLLLIILLTIVLMTILSVWFNNRVDKSKNYVTRDPGLPFLGVGLDYAGKTSEETLKNLIKFSKKHNGLGRSNAGHHKMIMVALPEHIEAIATDWRFFEKAEDYNMFRAWLQEGIVTTNDKKKWQSRRKIVTPSFHFKILEDFVQVFDAQADIFVNILGRHNGNDSFNVCKYVTLYTLDVVCETSMGIKINAQDEVESEYSNAIKGITKNIQWRQSHFLARDNWYWNLTPQKRQHDKLVKVVHNFITDVVEKRKEERARKGSNSVNEVDDFGMKRKAALIDILLDSKIDGQPLTAKEVHEEVNTFMFAGHDTTTSAIEFLLYNLAKYPNVQEKVYNEVIDVFGKDFSEPVTLTKLNNLTYLDLVMKESFRLNPPVPMIARYLREDVEINGVVYPKNHNVCLFIYNLHRDERFHKNAESFIPERFSEQKSHETMNAYSYIPFAAGHRNCIGQKFAQYEIKTLISKVIHKYALKLEDGFEVRLSYDLVLRPTAGIMMELTERN